MGRSANIVGCEDFLVLRRKVKSSFAFVTEKSLVDANKMYANGERDLDTLKESLGIEQTMEFYHQTSVNECKIHFHFVS